MVMVKSNISLVTKSRPESWQYISVLIVRSRAHLQGFDHGDLGLVRPWGGTEGEHEDDSGPRDCCQDPGQNVLCVFADALLVLEEEEGESVTDEGGRHVHCPEDTRVAGYCRGVGVVGEKGSLQVEKKIFLFF